MVAINNSSNIQPATAEAGPLQKTTNVPKDPPIVLPTGEAGSPGAFLAERARIQAEIQDLLNSNDKDKTAKIMALMGVTTPDINVVRIKQRINQTLGPEGQPLLQQAQLPKPPTGELQPSTGVDSAAQSNQPQTVDIQKALNDINKKLDVLNNSIQELLARLAEQDKSEDKSKTENGSQTQKGGSTGGAGGVGATDGTTSTGGANPPASTANYQKLILQFIAAIKDILALFELILKNDQNSPSVPTGPTKVQAMQKEPILA